ncbi:Hexadecenal dehydrogenase, partial [Marasmius crinis-equi]
MHMIGDIYHLDALPKMHAQLTDTFNSGKLKPLLYRKYQLLQLAKMIQENEERIQEALMADMMRPAFETNFAELTATLYELKNTYKHISSWSKPHKPPFSFHWSPHRRSIHKTPKGVVLIISPFNYPIFLSLVPLASALAAGNCVVIKPSDAVPKTSSLIEQLVKQYLDPEVVRVVNGGIQETSQLLELPWGHVLFTGSQKVGKIVAAAAAKHLTPVTLE